MGLLAEELGGASIILEHRYWGDSNPFETLTTENMKYLTLENAIQDIIHFAQNVELPFAPDGTTATDCPWVLFGGSYAGGVVSWTASLYPDTFWAYYSSSGSMQAIESYWEYFVRIERGMAKNCSKDVAGVVDYMDNVFLHGSDQNITDLKAKFTGLESLQNNDLMNVIGLAPGMWQLGDATDNHLFLTWCDYIENVNVTSAVSGPEGVGVEAALSGYVKWWNEAGHAFFREFLNCNTRGLNDYDCFDSHNASSVQYTDVSRRDLTLRSYQWLLCSQPFGLWQTGAPAGRPSLVSRLVDDEYFKRICGLYFPPGPDGVGYDKGRTVDDTNAYTGGWNPKNVSRIVYVDGEFDPWASLGVASDFRPGGPLQSSEEVLVLTLPRGHHCTDMYAWLAPKYPELQEVIDQALAQIVKWVGEWPGKKE
ncbi:unnamed protein product [Zymoseptoria tritici ST99CH_1A5]|uniref:Serine carboxypeptidase S28 n=2 Tax=Zymoseptoria tritici TaxID=1047171 RepID=A0A2H1GPJ3_ZYMTR|nr:unnamed protein product [Zymoseptoria tritici ST99CH_1E4]SMR57889.1 unnamed protein product [Zymoseptoria tritici ST99CH_3D1]SMY26324.1 unnamed protein product [Zymoseptoria tritici ST99CH_1A5]